MKGIIIGILLLVASLGNCQNDSIWIEGDHVCMNKGKAIQFAKMKDSLSFLKEELILQKSLLFDCRLLASMADTTLNSTISRCNFLEEKIVLLEDQLGLANDEKILREKSVESLVIMNKKIDKEKRKFKVQRDILIGTGVSLGVTVIVLIIINAL